MAMVNAQLLQSFQCLKQSNMNLAQGNKLTKLISHHYHSLKQPENNLKRLSTNINTIHFKHNVHDYALSRRDISAHLIKLNCTSNINYNLLKYEYHISSINIFSSGIHTSLNHSGAPAKSTGDSAILKDVDDVAKFIKDKAWNILVMTGAGLSTPSGIPDFRSPDTGLYHNLQKYNLPYPEAIFDINYFMMDHKPFYSLASELYPGVKYKPNIGHYFLYLLYKQQKLQKIYTQNIDGLERLAGLPDEKLMEAHGTFSTASCTLCHQKQDADLIKRVILEGSEPLHCSDCKGKVKPDIVFFGEMLPESFWNFQVETHFSDLLIIIGTSLEVYPFASIADAVGHNIPRVLINKHSAGSIGTRPKDLILTGDLVDTFTKLAESLGWEEDLQDLIEDD